MNTLQQATQCSQQSFHKLEKGMFICREQLHQYLLITYQKKTGTSFGFPT